MARKIVAKKLAIITGDYMSPNKKLLVNIGEQRKSWLEKVAELADPGTSVTEVMKAALDLVAVEDPESFAVKVQKWRLKNELEKIERAEKELAEKKQQLVDSLEKPTDGRIASHRK